MPRRPRFCPAGYPLHVIQRGNNRNAIFTCEDDFAAYAAWLAEGAQRYDLAVHGWVLMTNHVHLLVTPSDETGLSQLMQYLGRLYVRYFNYAYTRSGTLFEGRFKSCVVQEDRYLLNCLRYIELNPVRAGMVVDPGDYHWSSYQAHAFGARPRLWSPHRLYRQLAHDGASRQRIWQRMTGKALKSDVLAKIRHCANTGLVLGNEVFREQVGQLRR